MGFSWRSGSCLHARFLAPDDSGFPVKPTHRNPSIGQPQTNNVRLHGHLSVRPIGRTETTRTKSTNEWLSEEQFQHAPNSEERVGGTSKSLNVRQEHSHELHPCAHPCCQRTGTSNGGLVCGVRAVILEVLVLALLFFRRSWRRFSWRSSSAPCSENRQSATSLASLEITA